MPRLLAVLPLVHKVVQRLFVRKSREAEKKERRKRREAKAAAAANMVDGESERGGGSGSHGTSGVMAALGALAAGGSIAATTVDVRKNKERSSSVRKVWGAFDVRSRPTGTSRYDRTCTSQVAILLLCPSLLERSL